MHGVLFLRWFSAYFSVLAIQITERGSNFNDMQPRFTLANQGIEKFLERKIKKKMVIRIVLRYTLVYITDILLVFIQNTAIIKEGIFLEELSVLKRQNSFCLLFTVCNFMFCVRLNFVGQSVLYSSAYLSDRHQNYLM